MNGHNEVAELLIARGAKIEIKTTAFGAPLHVAATTNNVAMVLLLLRHGADPNIRTTGGYTPLHKAAEYGAVGVIRVLLENGADVNGLGDASDNTHPLADRPGISPLHLAASGNHTEAVAMLREAGAGSLVLEPVTPFMATASVERGQMLFVAYGCGGVDCHGDPNDRRSDHAGPTLWGVVGRPVASLPGYEYSTALRNLGGIWSEERIYTFISQPTVVAPGTRMYWQARGEPQQRADLIAYLRTLSDTSQ